MCVLKQIQNLSVMPKHAHTATHGITTKENNKGHGNKLCCGGLPFKQ